MAHTNKRKQALQEKRGATFEGFRPRVEDNFKIKKRKSEKKHKKDLTKCFE